MGLVFRRPSWSRLALPTAVCVVTGFAASTDAASVRTRNFVVQAEDPNLAKRVGEEAERFRRELSQHWLGRELPPWQTPCPIDVRAGNVPAQGVTNFMQQPVRDFRMQVIGTPQRILDSVLPHEVTHTILASHFGRPLPRWADEGICSTVENHTERAKLDGKLREFLSTGRGIAMNRLMLLTEYPPDMLPMYAQGYSVCQFLIAQGTPRQFVDFLGDYMRRPSWTDNVREHYGYESLAELQDHWLAWVRGGGGDVTRFVKNTRRDDNPTVEPERDPAPRAGTALASLTPSPAATSTSDVGDSWYKRRRDGRADSSPEIRTAGLAPPSVRTAGRYNAASPQAEGR